MANSGLTEKDIYNLVLDQLANEGVLSRDDDAAVARWLNRNFPVQRDVLMARAPWNFAVKRAALAVSAATPAFEWDYQYATPPDCLRVLPITRDGERDAPGIPHVVEGNFILTDASAPLYIRYIARITNTGLWSVSFCDVLSQVLAARFAHWMTGKASYQKFLLEQLPTIINDAIRLDSLEGTPEPPDDSDIIEVR